MQTHRPPRVLIATSSIFEKKNNLSIHYKLTIQNSLMRKPERPLTLLHFAMNWKQRENERCYDSNNSCAARMWAILPKYKRHMVVISKLSIRKLTGNEDILTVT